MSHEKPLVPSHQYILGPDLCLYKLITGKTGRRWLVAIQPNEANNVYCEGGPNSDGFGGAHLAFKLDDGTALVLAGPWQSNADSLFEDTGYDCRDKYTSQGIIALGRDSDWNKGDLYKGVLHYDKKPVIGTFDRIEKMAQEKANELGKTVFYSVRSSGGGSSCSCEPQGHPVSTDDPGDPNYKVVEVVEEAEAGPVSIFCRWGRRQGHESE